MGQQAEDRVPFTGGAGAGVCKCVTGGWPSFAVNMTRESSRGVEECYCMEGSRGLDDDLSPRQCEYQSLPGEFETIRLIWE